MFLPEPVRGKADPGASVNQVLPGFIMPLGVAGRVMMGGGDGSTLTWFGAGLFILFMDAFPWGSNAGIEHQNREIDELIEKHR